MMIERVFAGIQRVYIETAPFIYYAENRVGYVEKMKAVFKQIMDNNISVITSTITLSECLTKPLKVQNWVLVKEYEALLRHSSNIYMVSVDAEISRKSADIRAQYNLHTPDAIHIATGIYTNCQILLSNDMAFKRISNISTLLLDEIIV